MRSIILVLLLSLVTVNVLSRPKAHSAHVGLQKRGLPTSIVGGASKAMSLVALKETVKAMIKTYSLKVAGKALTSFRKVIPDPKILAKIPKRPAVQAVAKVTSKIVRKLTPAPAPAEEFIKIAKNFPKRFIKSLAWGAAAFGLLFVVGNSTLAVINDKNGNEFNITIDPLTGLPMPDQSGKQSVYSNTDTFIYQGKPIAIIDPYLGIQYFLNQTSMKYYCMDVNTSQPKYYQQDNTDSCINYQFDEYFKESYYYDAQGLLKWKADKVINGTEYLENESGKLYTIGADLKVHYKPDEVIAGVEYFKNEDGDLYYYDDKGEPHMKPYLTENGVEYFLDKATGVLFSVDANGYMVFKVEMKEGGVEYYKQLTTGFLLYIDSASQFQYKMDTTTGSQGT